MLKFLNTIFKISPVSTDEITSNFLCKYIINYIFQKKFLLINLLIVYFITAFSIQYFNLPFHLLDSVRMRSYIPFYMILYLLFEGILNPTHWIELYIMAIMFQRIKIMYKMIQPTIVTKKEFLIAAIYPLTALLFLLDITHLAAYGISTFLKAKSDLRYFYALFLNPCFYLSSFLMTMVLVVVSYRIFLKIHSIIIALIVSAFLIYFVMTAAIYIFFSIFIEQILFQLYRNQNFALNITLQYIPYIIISLILIMKYGNYLEKRMYDRFGEMR